MENTKIVKAYCSEINRYFLLEVKQFGSTWKVVDMTLPKSDEERDLVMTEVRQDNLETNSNLIACTKCGNRKIGGCSCSRRKHSCSPRMGYEFDCIYCDKLKIDYTRPTKAVLDKYKVGDTITLAQGKEVKVVTFSNVEWIKFDNINYHTPAPMYHEPKVHVVANEENIEFHGYNISAMDEGVYYEIGKNDDFEIECNVDTSKIKPHPGGYFYIDFGKITANISLSGGQFFIDNKFVTSVGSKFKMKLCRINGGEYQIYINDKLVGSCSTQESNKVKVIFGFRHDSHHCSELSHAYLKNISMVHGIDRQ